MPIIGKQLNEGWNLACLLRFLGNQMRLPRSLAAVKHAHCARRVQPIWLFSHARPAPRRGALAVLGASRSHSTAHARHLFAVVTLTILNCSRGGRVGANESCAEIAFLHLDEVLLILGAQALENRWMHHDAQLEVRFVAGTVLRISPAFAGFLRSWSARS